VLDAVGSDAQRCGFPRAADVSALACYNQSAPFALARFGSYACFPLPLWVGPKARRGFLQKYEESGGQGSRAALGAELPTMLPISRCGTSLSGSAPAFGREYLMRDSEIDIRGVLRQYTSHVG